MHLPYSTEEANAKLKQVRENVGITIAVALKKLGGSAKFKFNEFCIGDTTESSLRYIGYNGIGEIEISTEDSDGILEDFNVLEQIEILYALENRLGINN